MEKGFVDLLESVLSLDLVCPRGCAGGGGCLSQAWHPLGGANSYFLGFCASKERRIEDLEEEMEAIHPV